MSACLHVHRYITVICICIHAHMCFCRIVYMYVCFCVYVHTCICVYVHMCIYAPKHICVYLYAYMYIWYWGQVLPIAGAVLAFSAWPETSGTATASSCDLRRMFPAS